ncbi:MAG: hypothetical protein ACE5F5_10360 [Acidimicrobiia bacterium]
MTARPLSKNPAEGGFRVLSGRRIRRPSIAPWMIMALIGVVAFLGLGFARTSLDRSAFELAELQKAIAEQSALRQQLELEIARLENPARIAPLAEEMGLVVPDTTRQLLVDITPAQPLVAGHEEEETNQ